MLADYMSPVLNETSAQFFKQLFNGQMDQDLMFNVDNSRLNKLEEFLKKFDVINIAKEMMIKHPVRNTLRTREKSRTRWESLTVKPRHKMIRLHPTTSVRKSTRTWLRHETTKTSTTKTDIYLPYLKVIHEKMVKILNQLKNYEKSVRLARTNKNPWYQDYEVETDSPETDALKKDIMKAMKQTGLGYLRMFGAATSSIVESSEEWIIERLAGATESVVVIEYIVGGKLDDIGHVNTMALKSAVQELNSHKTDYIKNVYAGLMKDRLFQLKDMAPDTIYLLKTADGWHNDEEGEKLINTIPKLKGYPHNNINRLVLLREIVEAILRPFFRKQGHKDREELIRGAEVAFIERNIGIKRRKEQPHSAKEMTNQTYKVHDGHTDKMLLNKDIQDSLGYSEEEEDLKANLKLALAQGTVELKRVIPKDEKPRKLITTAMMVI